ncbi:glycosyltransferase family 2 protein, partial [Ectothiorhodospira lacustris]|uniref:glycosyltransferase family 2 protein n=1 Tax=Ectothiorhodospira lacustris TaxID=2899127 RepID=UPI001EE926C9
MKKISIIIPAYNAEEFIRKSIESALNQNTEADLEIIVINDGSTDNTEREAKSYLPKIKYISTENRGVSAARNLGIMNATGDFICFLDADDTWHPNKLKIQLELFKNHPELGTVICDERHIDRAEKVILASFFQTHPMLQEIEDSKPHLSKPISCLIKASLFPTSGVMTRSEILRK